MDVEELKKALKSDEGKALVAGMIETEVKGLKTKRDELLDNLKKEKEEKSDLAKRISVIEDEKAQAKEEALNKTGDVEKITASLKEKHAKDLSGLNETIDGLNGKLNKHVVGKGLTEALVKAGVQAPLMAAAKALIETTFKGEVGDNDGTPFAKFDGKAVNEFVTSWAESDTGKHFVSAKSNSGGGSQGAGDGDKVSDAKTIKRSEFDKMNPVEHGKFFSSGGKVTD